MLGAVYAFWKVPSSYPYTAAALYIVMSFLLYIPQMLIAAMAMNLGTKRQCCGRRTDGHHRLWLNYYYRLGHRIARAVAWLARGIQGDATVRGHHACPDAFHVERRCARSSA